MAAIPLENSNSPPHAVSSDHTRSYCEQMEDIHSESIRKRPRLDTGNGTCEILTADKSDIVRPQVSDQEVPVFKPSSRITVDMRSPASAGTTHETSDASPSLLAVPSAQSPHIEADTPTAISISSSPTQSPEIEVAEIEDMDQDPNTSSWRPLGEVLRAQSTPGAVQFHAQLSLADSFPSFHSHVESQPRRPLDTRENLEEIGTAILKGTQFDVPIFLEVKDWLDTAVQSLDQLTYETFTDSRDFWDDFPIIMDYFLRRWSDFQPDEGQGVWVCFEEFCLDYARLALHLIQLDTEVMKQLAEDQDVQSPDLISRNYLPSLGWILNISPVPFFRAMEKTYGSHVSNMVARINDQVVSPPFNAVRSLSEYTRCLLALVPRLPVLSQVLALVLPVAHLLIESGSERRKYSTDETFIDTPVYKRTLKAVYTLLREVDEKYQMHVSKKLPWATGDMSDTILRYISMAYHCICLNNIIFASQEMARDLGIRLPEDATTDDSASIILYGWRLGLLKKQVMDGRMELRVHGMETMQNDLVNAWRLYLQNDPPGDEHPVIRYLVSFLRESRIVDYVLGVDSHPQLIGRSANIVGFLVVTSTYTDLDTDTIWKTVTESQDPRTVTEVLGMFTKVFNILQPTALLYLCSKLIELPLDRFDARMIEFCEQLFNVVREKHADGKRAAPLDNLHVDAVPVRLCVRLIRESSAMQELSVDQKTHLQRFAGSQLSQFINAGLSEADKMETYELCIQDIAEMNQFTVGSSQALQALLPSYDSQEIRKLAADFDLPRLVIAETCHALDMGQSASTDEFSETGFLSRIQILARIIDHVPDTITPDLADMLWNRIFISKDVIGYIRRASWDMLCAATRRSAKPNSFIDHCIHVCLPQLSPENYSSELLPFVKQTIGYEVRFNPPPPALEREVISIPGMDRVWNLILAAPPDTIESDATNFAIELYLDHNLISRSPRSAAEATHIALVDRCVEQLRSAAAKLKPVGRERRAGQLNLESSGAWRDEVRAAEQRFSRCLLFLRQLLHGLRSRSQYATLRDSPTDVQGGSAKGELINIPYQAFDGGTNTQVRSLRIDDLSTASELTDNLSRLTGFAKFNIIYRGKKIDILQEPERTLRDLDIRSGLLIIRRDAGNSEASQRGLRQSLTLVDSEVLKHFDTLYDFLFLEDHLAREIYDFLTVFPPQDRVLQLVKSADKGEQNMFPMDKPYIFLYSISALSVCLKEESLKAQPDFEFVTYSISVLNATLTRPEISGTLEGKRNKQLFASSLVECLLLALVVKPRQNNVLTAISSPEPLVQQLRDLISATQHLSATYLSEDDIQKLICNSFSVLVEASVHDPSFWNAVKKHIELDRLLISLLLDQNRQGVRKEIAETIMVTCSLSQLKSSDGSPVVATPEDPLKMDILWTVWDAFVQALPDAAAYSHQSCEFFEAALLVFHSIAEKPHADLKFGDYLKCCGNILLEYRTVEFVGREPADHMLLGLLRLIKACLDLADASGTPMDTFDLAEKLFDNYLFPDLSLPSSEPITPKAPVMHTQTRQELYNVLKLLCRRSENYMKMVESLEDIIPRDYALSPNWVLDRSKMIRSPEGYAGLKNLSNTCYMNSLLTQLFMNVGFRKFMLHTGAADPESPSVLLEETKKVFGNMQETWLKSVDPQGLVDAIRTYDNEPIDVTVQMDVDEFYNLLFDRWESQIVEPEARKRFRSFYGGQLVQQIKSKECPHISERLEPFSAIQCDIKGKASLEESLQAYVEGEIMQGDNKYSCTSCGRHVDAVKRACLKDVPDNLIFHLKRFDFDMVTMMRSKINDEFQFPEYIDMSPFTVEYLSDQSAAVEPDVFELVGVLVHSGTAESGHYYSFTRERPAADPGGSWVEFNDSDVSKFDPSKIPDQCFGGYNEPHHSNSVGAARLKKAWNAYMLFYERSSAMESAKSIYKPAEKDVPVRAQLPVALSNHIAMENELFIRTYCLLDPSHNLFVRYLLSHLYLVTEMEAEEGKKLDRSVLFVALDTLEQLISRSKELAGLDGVVSELIKAVVDTPEGALWVLQWTRHRATGIRNLVLRSPHGNVRTGSIKIIVTALTKLRELGDEGSDSEREKRRAQYATALDGVVAVLESSWPLLQTLSRPWDDYFDFLLQLSAPGAYEAGVLLSYGFLTKCLEMAWLDQEDSKRLKRYYMSYCRLIDKGRKFSLKRLMDLLYVLLTYIDFSAAPAPDDERQTAPNGKYRMTAIESCLVRPVGRNRELLMLKKVLQQYINPQACRNITRLLLDAPPEAGLIEPICQTLEDGLRIAPAELCAPFLEATLVFCQRSSDEEQILYLIDFVAKGVDTINNSGGPEHLAFITNALTLSNDRAGFDKRWFLSRVADKIPDWAPPLLLYPDKMVRNMTVEVLRQVLFSTDSPYTDVAKELVKACVERLKATYVTARQNVEARTVEAINTVISCGLEAYYDDSGEDQEFVRYANEVHSAVEELTVDVPEELASEEWEGNSIIPSDSEMGLAGSP